MGSGESDSETDSLLFELKSVRESIKGLKEHEQALRELIRKAPPEAPESTTQEAAMIFGDEPKKVSLPVEKPGSGIVTLLEREQPASRLASPLVDARPRQERVSDDTAD